MVEAKIEVLERRIAELESSLEASERRERALALKADLIEHAQQAFIVTDLEGTVIFMNDYAARLYGWPVEETVGMSIMDVTVSEGAREHAQEIMAALKAGHSWQGEFEVKRRDGSNFVAHVLDAPLLDADGALVGVIGVSTDITDELRREGAARLARGQLQRALEVAKMAAWTWSLATDEVQWSKEVTALLDLDEAPDASRDWTKLLAPEDLERATLMVEQARAGADEVELQCPIVVSGREAGHIHVKGARVSDNRGQAKFVGVVQDVTAQVRAREENEELREHLDHIQKMEAIGRLAGGVAHDMNNLLTGVLMYGSLLQDSPHCPASFAQPLEAVIGLCERGRDLTSNLLGFARRGKYQQQRVDVRRVVADTVELLRRTIPKTIELQVDLAASAPVWWGDRGQLHQLVMNLCLNAVDAVGDGGTLCLRATAETVAKTTSSQSAVLASLSDGDYVRLDVIDDGCGMNEETLARAVEPFFTTKADRRGTGLGLSMAYGTAHNHGGALSIRSTVDVGTTVSVWIPAAETTMADGSGDEAPQPGAVGGHVLVVDDEEAIREATMWALEAMGYEVTTACDGEDALQRLGQAKGGFTLVVLDLVMPVMGGVETFHAMREQVPSLPILIVSGHSERGDAAALLAAGAAGFLQKPYTIRDLKQAMARALA